MSQAPGPRRYAKSESTIGSIAESARKLFVRKGFDAVSLREIAVEAGLSHSALRRYFATTGQILDHIVSDYEQRNHAWISAMDLDLASLQAAIPLARHNSTIPGYVELFTALAGVAVARDHPAHERMSARYRAVRAANMNALDGDVARSALFPALSDGLQLASLFDDSVEVADELEAYLEFAGRQERGVSPEAQLRPVPDRGLRHADDTRSVIIRSAAEIFARRGYHAASVAAIAHRAEVSKSTLLHHFTSKFDLLLGVLQDLESILSGGVDSTTLDAAARMHRFVERVTPALLSEGASTVPEEAFVVLFSEAASPEHPAHPWFRERMNARRAQLASDICTLRGDAASPASDDRSALWLSAARDGLRLQWLYDRDVDASAALRLLATDLTATDSRTGGVRAF